MTLLLSRRDVERLLLPELCIEAVEDAFRALGRGTVPPPGVLGMHGDEGSFHLKAGFLGPFFAAKLNANFPKNGERRGLPTIQGAVMLSDATSGVPLAIMDSGSITALRTAAATAVAARHLAPRECETALLCGCGGQAEAQLRALLCVRKPGRVLAYDLDGARAKAFAAKTGVQAAGDLGAAIAASRIIITCTTARRFFITSDLVRPGTFVAAVGADNEDKQEIDPALLARAKVVTDLTEQASRIGELHHAIDAGAMAASDVHAELADIVVGRKEGRNGEEEITIFDSTGTGLQDVAAAIAVYRAAVEAKAGQRFALSESEGCAP